MNNRTDLDLRLINQFQHNMPICSRPYQLMAKALDCSEQDVLDCLERLAENGVLSRIGPVFDHQQAGASTLAALAVPEHRLEKIAQIVSSYREVNHNYERDGDWNLWFVVTAPTTQHLNKVLKDIQQQTGLKPLDLPMITPFHIDLGFSIDPLDLKGLS